MVQQTGVLPAELRPRRRWYFVALGVFLICCAVGVALFVWQFAKVADGVNLQEMRAGANKVRLTANEEKGIYATGKVDRTSLPRCVQNGPGRLTIGPVSSTETFTTEGTTWHLIAKVTVTETGTYTVNCMPPGSTRFAIGNRVGGLFLGGLGAFGMLVGLVFLGAIAGGVIAIVVALRRNGHRKRLLAAAAPAGPHFPGPPAGMPYQPPGAPVPPQQPAAPQQPPAPGQPPQAPAHGQPPIAGQPQQPPAPGQPLTPGQPDPYGRAAAPAAEPEPPTVPGHRTAEPPDDQPRSTG